MPRVPFVRALVGGGLMGVANLVPGVSGGTMLVAAGIYDRFIQSIASVTRLKRDVRAIALLALVVLGALIAIGGGAKGISIALAEARWQTYCVFIGLTLGGVPAMIGFCKPISRSTWAGVIAGFSVMLALVVVQTQTSADGTAAVANSNWVMLTIGGAAGAGAMILPGVSGAYLLLLLGQYRTIVDAIRDTVAALGDADVAGVLGQMGVLVPVGVGVLLGVVVISNLLKLALQRARSVTMGVLLGLLIAAPIGLWPYKQPVAPVVGDVFKGEPVTADNLAEVTDPSESKDWQEVSFTPSPAQIGISILLIAAGAAVTLSVAAVGSRLDRAAANRAEHPAD